MSSAMNLMPRVIALVGRLAGDEEGVTVDDLLPHFPAATRLQVMQAMQNARARNRIEMRKPSAHLGIGVGTLPATYGPIRVPEPAPLPVEPVADADPPRGAYGIGRVASVWELANDTTRRAA